MAEDGSLIISSALEDDSAVYQCFASSEAGETYAVMRLRIFGEFIALQLLSILSEVFFTFALNTYKMVFHNNQ